MSQPNRTANPGRMLADQAPEARLCINWVSIPPVSWIDHILLFQSTATLSLLGFRLTRSPTTISDKHRLYWNSSRVPGGPPTAHTLDSTAYHKKFCKVRNIFRVQSPKDQYQAIMQEWFHTHPCPTGTLLNPDSASLYLQQFSEASNGNTRGGSHAVMAGPHSCLPIKLTTTSSLRFKDIS
jgi:hypothetical protein